MTVRIIAVLKELGPGAWGFAALCLLALALLPFDKSLSGAVYRNPDLQGDKQLSDFLEAAGLFGKGDAVLLLILGAGLSGFRSRATAAVIALILCGVMVWPLKVTVQRERPRERSNLSFPSGDVATAASALFALTGGSVPAVAAGAVATGLVASYRVYCGAHYPSDAVAGAAVGVLAATVACAIRRRRDLTLPTAFFAWVASGLALAHLTIHLAAPYLPKFARPLRRFLDSGRFLDVYWPYLVGALIGRHALLIKKARFRLRNYLALL